MTYRMTKYEYVRVLGTRATQLSQGAPPTINIGNMTNVIDIAKEELKQKTLPLIIVRKLPNGQKIEIPVSNFI